jgi:hypothetical protein
MRQAYLQPGYGAGIALGPDLGVGVHGHVRTFTLGVASGKGRGGLFQQGCLQAEGDDWMCERKRIKREILGQSQPGRTCSPNDTGQQLVSL